VSRAGPRVPLEAGVPRRRRRERVDEPKTKRTIRNYCSKLEQYNLIRAEGQKRGRRYRLSVRAPKP
jgi:hypothetical protein